MSAESCMCTVLRVFTRIIYTIQIAWALCKNKNTQMVSLHQLDVYTACRHSAHDVETLRTVTLLTQMTSKEPLKTGADWGLVGIGIARKKN